MERIVVIVLFDAGAAEALDVKQRAMQKLELFSGMVCSL